MTIVNLGTSNIIDSKEQLLYIYNGYKNSRPGQSNLFNSILRTYKGDMLDNAGNTQLQKDAIVTSLNTILGRYNYNGINVTVDFIEKLKRFEVSITVVDDKGETIKLSDGLMFE